MPKYAVDFIAEIQEVASVPSPLRFVSSDLDESVEYEEFTSLPQPPPSDHNGSNALMGNAQHCCCLKRNAGRSPVAHRHVVVSRGVQCSDFVLQSLPPLIVPNPVAAPSSVAPQGDVPVKNILMHQQQHQCASIDYSQSPSEPHRRPSQPQTAPQVFTLVSQEPPELRESSRFSKRPLFSDHRKCHRFLEDDIDSLSATISNYSLHDKLLRLDTNNANEGEQQHQLVEQCGLQSPVQIPPPPALVNPTPRPRQPNWRGSTEAIRGSMSGTVRSTEARPVSQHPKSSDSLSSSLAAREPRSMLHTTTAGSGDNTVISVIDDPDLHPPAASVLHKPAPTVPVCVKRPLSPVVLPASVTFMRGSEEFKPSDPLTKIVTEPDNLNVLRRKQKFLMRHTRSSSQVPPTSPHGEPAIPPQSPAAPHISRPASANRTSISSDRYCPTPNTARLRRSVSFDRPAEPKPPCSVLTPAPTPAPASAPAPLAATTEATPTNSRNSVRAKYCSSKLTKHKFYIPESANIEAILRDPSDRRIKAICDRHNCDIEIYSKVPRSGFLQNIIILAAPNGDSLRKCVRSLDCSMHWCLTAQLS